MAILLADELGRISLIAAIFKSRITDFILFKAPFEGLGLSGDYPVLV